MLAAGNVIALDVQEPHKFLENIAYTCEHLYPRPKLLVLNYPHNPSSVVVEQAFFDEVVKLARKYGQHKRNGAYEVITTDHSFHGRSLAMLTAFRCAARQL